jgi:hypothetical protein
MKIIIENLVLFKKKNRFVKREKKICLNNKNNTLFINYSCN